MESPELRNRVPQHTIGSIDLYVSKRIPPGGFLRAVLENNLREAFARADNTNRYAMYDIVNYIYNCVPYDCWGSPENVKAWLKGRKDGAPRSENRQSSDEDKSVS